MAIDALRYLRPVLMGMALSAVLLPTAAVADDDTTVVSNLATISSCRQITTSSLLIGDDDGDGSTSVEFNTADAWPGTTACSSVTGPSSRQCLVPELLPAGSYYLRFTHADPDGITGLNPEVLGPLALPPCGPDQAAPTVMVLSPSRGAIVGGPERIKIQVFDSGGLEAGTPVQVAVDGGAPSPAAVNGSYGCGLDCEVYELTLDTTALGNGSHTLSIQATDAGGNVALIDRPLAVSNLGSLPTGDGRLLRRSYGSRLCLDCHDLPTHSSQATGTAYGNWAVGCLVCHTPHRTRNIYLVRESVRTPSSGVAAVRLFFDDAGGGTNPQMSYLGDYSGAGNSPYDDGICEVCHTRTNHYRNDASGGDHSHNAGTRCVTCHPHQMGFRGGGSGQAHVTHTVEEYGPKMTCVSGNLGCHGSQPAPLLSDGVDLAATTSCDACHSPSGSYNGVHSVGDSVGAKDNWPDGVYDGGGLAAGKEKWCVGCHDEVPSLINGVTAPNVAGGEDDSFRYGTGWGYYKTGHGLPFGAAYPSSGGEVLGAGMGCDGCHEFTTTHIDGLARTYADPGTPSSYQGGYRLASVGGEDPLEVPRDNYCPWDGEPYNNQLLVDPIEFRLCFSCHASEPFTEASSTETNFRNAGTGTNAHYEHLSYLQDCGPGPIYHTDWDASHARDSRATCMTCHNVHGSTQLAMVRDGKLVDKEPGLEVAYYNSGVTYQCTGPSPFPPTPPDVTLGDSTGTVWNATLDHLCNDCHGGCGFDQLYLRTPFDSTPPEIEDVYGRVGSSILSVWFSEGVYTNTGALGDLTAADFSLTDLDNARSIAGISHNAGEAFALLTLSAPLDSSDDLDTDTLGAATVSSIYDDADNPMDTSPETIEGDGVPPSISDETPANATTDVAIDGDVAFTLSDSDAGVDWTTFSIQLSGDKGYSQTYTDSDVAVVSQTGNPAAYAVTVNPSVDFGTGEIITVTVDVDDLVGNSMSSAVWSFTTVAAGTPQTVTLHPSDVASAGGFSVSGGTWPDVLDTHDGDTSYAYFCCSAPGQIFYVDMDDLGLGGVTIQDLTVYVYARYRNSPSPGGTPYAGNVNIGYRTGTSTVWNGNTTTDTSGDYNLITSATYTTDSDGGALDVADINSLQVAVQRNTSGSTQLRVTEVYVEVTYLP